ncbi:MAG: MBL fold metallo-hydrolase [Desulfurococcales archaeon]|nr:MBL fold metallo-hydrolase [Desulfurococcales archaeon]
MVKITWHLHSFFEILSGKGTRILIDPHDGGSLNLERPEPGKPIHAILVTHNHFDHNATGLYASRDTRIFKSKTGEFTINDIVVRGVKVPHDEAGGRRRGHVVAYRIMIDGISISHLGDIGTEKLEKQVLDELKADVLMIPVGGVFTIGPAAAIDLVERLSPRMVIPMHFWVRGLTLPLEPLDTFLNLSRYRRLRVSGRTIEFSSEDLPDKTTILVFEL